MTVREIFQCLPSTAVIADGAQDWDVYNALSEMGEDELDAEANAELATFGDAHEMTIVRMIGTDGYIMTTPRYRCYHTAEARTESLN